MEKNNLMLNINHVMKAFL